VRRRDVLKAGAAALATPLADLRPARALAQGKPEKLVVMTWGGLWGDSLRQGVDAPFTKATGVAVVQDRGWNPAERITKLKASLGDQAYDVLQLHDGLYPLAVKQGVIEPIDRSSPRLTNLKDIYPQFIYPNWVVQIFSAIGVTYNTKRVKDPPSCFADLWRPEFKGRIVLPEISHSIGTYIIPIGAMAAGKSPRDVETGFEMLKKMVDLKPIWARDTDIIMSSLRDEEADIAVLYKSQTYTVQGWGAPVEWVYPKEGAIAISWGTGIARNTKNRALAETYLNQTLDPEGQTFFTQAFNYPGSNRKEVDLLPQTLRERARVTEDEMVHLVELDQEFMSDQRAAWTERWNRVVTGG